MGGKLGLDLGDDPCLQGGAGIEKADHSGAEEDDAGVAVAQDAVGGGIGHDFHGKIFAPAFENDLPNRLNGVEDEIHALDLGEEFAGIEDPVGVEEGLDAALQGETFGAEFQGDEGGFFAADAVLTGQGAAEGEDLLEKALESVAGAGHFGLVAGMNEEIDVEIAIAGMTEADDEELLIAGDGLDFQEQLQQAADGDDHVLIDLEGGHGLGGRG